MVWEVYSLYPGLTAYKTKITVEADNYDDAMCKAIDVKVKQEWGGSVDVIPIFKNHFANAEKV